MSTLSFFDFTGWTLDILRRILYLGTRTRVFPESAEELGLRRDLPLCYVLHEHHLSNLLVLDEECRQLGLPAAMKPLRSATFTSPRSFFFFRATNADAWCRIRATTMRRCSSPW